MPHRISFLIYKITIFVLFICSMYPWFVWNIPGILLNIIGATVSIIVFFISRKHFKIAKRLLIPSLLLIFTLSWNAFHLNINGAIDQFFLLITILLLINIKDELKADIFSFITNGMAILLSISLIFYFLFLIGVPLPSVALSDSAKGYSGLNYFGFIRYDDLRQYIRFSSIFAEPGHLSLGLIPLLYVNKLNLRNLSVLVVFVAELFTLSLAGYITLFICVVFYSFTHSKDNRYARFLLISSILFGIYVTNKLSEESPLNRAIVERLAFDENSGTIAGNNRTKSYTDIAFNNFIKSSDRFFGMDFNRYSKITFGSAGYKVYIMGYGLIGILLVVLFYLSYTLLFFKYEVLGFLLIMLMQQYQGGVPFWYAVIFGYILGISVLYNKNKDDVINYGETTAEIQLH